MIYESKHIGFGLTLASGEKITFVRRDWELPGGTVAYGQFDTNDAKTQSRTRKSEAQLCELLNASDAFRLGVAGHKGVWKQVDRLKEEQTLTNSPLFESELANLTDVELLSACGELKIALPLEPTRPDMIAALVAAKSESGITLVQVIRASVGNNKQSTGPLAAALQPPVGITMPKLVAAKGPRRKGLETIAHGAPQAQA